MIISKTLAKGMLALIIIGNLSCTKSPSEKKIDELYTKANYLSDDIENYFEIKDSLSIENQLEVLLDNIDIVQSDWEAAIDTLQKNLTDEERYEIEQRTRERMREIEKVVVNNNPKFRILFSIE